MVVIGVQCFPDSLVLPLGPLSSQESVQVNRFASCTGLGWRDMREQSTGGHILVHLK